MNFRFFFNLIRGTYLQPLRARIHIYKNRLQTPLRIQLRIENSDLIYFDIYQQMREFPYQ